MLRRLIITSALLLLPATALAADASSLGPAATGLGTSTIDTSGILQPANPQILQSSGAGSATLVSPDSSGLQPAGSKDQQAIANYLTGEVIGSPQSPETSDGSRTAIQWSIIGSFIILAAAYTIYYALHTRHLKRRYRH